MVDSTACHQHQLTRCRHRRGVGLCGVKTVKAAVDYMSGRPLCCFSFGIELPSRRHRPLAVDSELAEVETVGGGEGGEVARLGDIQVSSSDGSDIAAVDVAGEIANQADMDGVGAC